MGDHPWLICGRGADSVEQGLSCPQCLHADYVRLLKYGDSLYRCKELKRAALVSTSGSRTDVVARCLLAFPATDSGHHDSAS